MEIITLKPTAFIHALFGHGQQARTLCLAGPEGQKDPLYFFRDGDRIWCMEPEDRPADGPGLSEELTGILLAAICGKASRDRILD